MDRIYSNLKSCYTVLMKFLMKSLFLGCGTYETRTVIWQQLLIKAAMPLTLSLTSILMGDLEKHYPPYSFYEGINQSIDDKTVFYIRLRM